MSGAASPPRLDVSLGSLGRHAAVYGLSFVIGRSAAFVMLPVYTRYLAPSDYGVLHLVHMTVDVAAILLVAGIRNGLFRFYFKAKGEDERRRVVATTFWLMQLFNATSAALLYALARPLASAFLTGPEDDFLLRIAAASVLLEPASAVGMLYMQARQQSMLFTSASTVRLILQVSLNVWFLVFRGMGVEGVLYSIVITNAVLGIAVGGWFVRQAGLRPSGRSVRDLLRFGLPYRVTQGGAFVLTFGDRYFLRAFATLTAVGVYSLAYQFGFLLFFLAQAPILQAWNPQRFELARAPRAERDALYNRGFLFYDLLGMTVAVGIALFVHPVLVVMSDPEYHVAADLVPILLGAYVLQGWKDVVEFGIQVSERTEYATYATWISVGVILGLYALLIPPFGAAGAAWATFVAFAVRLGFFYYWSQRLWPVSYRWAPHLRLLGYGAFVVVAWTVVPRPGLVGEFLLASLGFVVFLALAWFGSVLPETERAELVSFARARLRALVPG